MKKVKYLILGAGISGLSFARSIKDNNYLLIEKENRAGGLCKTHKVGDYIWDYAGHFFHFKNEDTRKYFEPILENEECIRKVKNAKIFYNNSYIDYPFQKNIHQLEKDDFIDCLYDLFFRTEKEQYPSFKNMLIGKFGKGICDRFLIPYNEKLYSCDLNTLDQDAMGRFFPYADLPDIIRNMKTGSNDSYNDTFTYPYEGAESVIKYLLKQVDMNNICLEETATEIDINKKIVKTNKDIYQFEYLINSMPFNHFVSLCGDESDISLSWNKVLVFNIGFDMPAVDKSIDWIYYPEADINFYRVGFYNNILLQEKLSIYVEIGFSRFDEVDVDRQYELTIKNLKKCGIINVHKVVNYESILMDPAYVHLSKASKEYMNKKESELSTKGIYTIGRYGGWTYCSMEDCFIQARNLAKKIGIGLSV